MTLMVLLNVSNGNLNSELWVLATSNRGSNNSRDFYFKRQRVQFFFISNVGVEGPLIFDNGPKYYRPCKQK